VEDDSMVVFSETDIF